MLTFVTSTRKRDLRARGRRGRHAVRVVASRVPRVPCLAMAPSPSDAIPPKRDDLFATVERLRDGERVTRPALSNARAEAAALASTLRGREDQVESLLRRLEDTEEKLARTRASTRDAELATRRLGAPPALAEDLWTDATDEAAASWNVAEAATTAVDAWGPEGDPRDRTDEPEVAARARRLVALARDLFDQERLLVEARARAHRETKTSPFSPRFDDEPKADGI